MQKSLSLILIFSGDEGTIKDILFTWMWLVFSKNSCKILVTVKGKQFAVSESRSDSLLHFLLAYDSNDHLLRTVSSAWYFYLEIWMN